MPEYDVLVTNPPYSGEHVVTWMCVSKICEQCKKEVTLGCYRVLQGLNKLITQLCGEYYKPLYVCCGDFFSKP